MVDILRRGVPRAEFACEVLEMCGRVVQLGEYVGVVVGRLDTWDDDLFGLRQVGAPRCAGAASSVSAALVASPCPRGALSGSQERLFLFLFTRSALLNQISTIHDQEACTMVRAASCAMPRRVATNATPTVRRPGAPVHPMKSGWYAGPAARRRECG